MSAVLETLANQADLRPQVDVCEIWQLIAVIQAETLELQTGAMRCELFLARLLEQDHLIRELLVGPSPVTVAIRPEAPFESAEELLQQLLVVLSETNTIAGAEGSKSKIATQVLQSAIHTYLRAALERDIEAKSDTEARKREMYNFAYGLSHEINNPLANIVARASDLTAQIESESVKRSLKKIADQAMRAHELLAEMMLAVQLPSIQLQPTDLRPLLVKLSQTWSQTTSERNLLWTEKICDEFLWSHIDKIAFSEALAAGLRNACDACQCGDSVVLLAERAESETGSLEVRIAIIDNGPGLTPEAAEHAWDIYYSGREAGRGLGIGLSKIRRIVHAHRGRVWIESNQGAGCGLEIRLPFKSPPRS